MKKYIVTILTCVAYIQLIAALFFIVLLPLFGDVDNHIGEIMLIGFGCLLSSVFTMALSVVVEAARKYIEKS